MSLFKPNLKMQKERLQYQIFVVSCKINNVTNERQRTALEFKKQELILKSNNLLKSYYLNK